MRSVLFSLPALALVGCLSAASAHIFAESKQSLKVHIPESVNVLYVDGEKYKKPFFKKNHTLLQLQTFEGKKHQLILAYEQVFEDGDDFDVVASEAFLSEFELPAHVWVQMNNTANVDVGAYSPIIVVGLDEPSTVEQAEQFAKQPALSFTLRQGAESSFVKGEHAKRYSTESLSGEVLPVSIRYSVKEESWLNSFTQERPQASQPMAPDAVSKGGVNKDDALQQLQFWWEKANPEQRREFRQQVLK